MSLYRKICYKVENLFIKMLSKTDEELKVNMQKAEFYRNNKKPKQKSRKLAS